MNWQTDYRFFFKRKKLENIFFCKTQKSFGLKKTSVRFFQFRFGFSVSNLTGRITDIN